MYHRIQFFMQHKYTQIFHYDYLRACHTFPFQKSSAEIYSILKADTEISQTKTATLHHRNYCQRFQKVFDANISLIMFLFLNFRRKLYNKFQDNVIETKFPFSLCVVSFRAPHNNDSYIILRYQYNSHISNVFSTLHGM